MFRLLRCAAAVLLMAAAAFAAQPDKVIRLRNERITTTPAPTSTPAAAKSANAANITGLFLIQFEGAPTAEQRQQLADLGVELLSYVPDDAFIADANQVPPGKLRALPFIRWSGPFKAEHKIHGKLTSEAAKKATPVPDLDVSVLLSPRAKPNDRAAAHRQLSRITGESSLRQGTILRGAIPASKLQQLAESPAVLWIEPAPHFKLND